MLHGNVYCITQTKVKAIIATSKKKTINQRYETLQRAKLTLLAILPSTVMLCIRHFCHMSSHAGLDGLAVLGCRGSSSSLNFLAKQTDVSLNPRHNRQLVTFSQVVADRGCDYGRHLHSTRLDN